MQLINRTSNSNHGSAREWDIASHREELELRRRTKETFEVWTKIFGPNRPTLIHCYFSIQNLSCSYCRQKIVELHYNP